MKSTTNWWSREIDWQTPAGTLLQKLIDAIPIGEAAHLTVYGSAPLQLTIDSTLLSGDVDIFSDDDDGDLESIVAAHRLGKEHGDFHIEVGYDTSFRTSPRWRRRARSVQRGRVTITIPHPIDVLIGKLNRLEPKDVVAFERVIALTSHPTSEELKTELQSAVDLFRPSFDETSPNSFLENTERLWREVFKSEIDVRKEIIQPGIALQKKGYGEPPPDYKAILREL